MKIAFDAKRAFNNFRGLGNYSRDTIRIVSSFYPENEYLLYTPKINSSIIFDYNNSCKVYSPQHKKSGIATSLWRTFALADEAKRCGVDVYHGLSHELPFGIEKKGIHTVVTMHDLIFLKFPELYPFFDRKMYAIKYLRSCKVADDIVAASEQTKRDLVELAGVKEEKITVVYQGCNAAFKVSTTEQQRAEIRLKYQLPEQFILNVGAIEERKNQLLILKALQCGKIDCPLVIVGRSGDYEKTLRTFIAEHNMEQQVKLLPNVPMADLPTLYQAASLFVYPSLFEGFGIPLLEALHSGLPVIAATGSCLEESGGEGSCYVSPYDAEELASAINKILSDRALQVSMQAKSAQHLLKFSDGEIARNLMQVYLR